MSINNRLSRLERAMPPVKPPSAPAAPQPRIQIAPSAIRGYIDDCRKYGLVGGKAIGERKPALTDAEFKECLKRLGQECPDMFPEDYLVRYFAWLETTR